MKPGGLIGFQTRHHCAKGGASCLKVLVGHLIACFGDGDELDPTIRLVLASLDEPHLDEAVDVAARGCNRQTDVFGNRVDGEQRMRNRSSVSWSWPFLSTGKP